jgi:hypothetical protein
VPNIEKKKKLDIEDVEILGLAKKMENLYKTVYKSTLNQNQYTSKNLNSIETNLPNFVSIIYKSDIIIYYLKTILSNLIQILC